jgi:hypothetical protein
MKPHKQLIILPSILPGPSRVGTDSLAVTATIDQKYMAFMYANRARAGHAPHHTSAPSLLHSSDRIPSIKYKLTKPDALISVQDGEQGLS